MIPLLLKDIRTYALMLLISFALFFIDQSGLLQPPKSLIQTVTIPIQYGLYRSSLAVGNQFRFIFGARRAVQEHKAMTEQLATLLSENSQLRKKLLETEAQLQQQNRLNHQEFD